MSRELGICGEIIITTSGGGSFFTQPSAPAVPQAAYGRTVGTDVLLHADGALVDNISMPTTNAGNWIGKLELSTIWTVTMANVHANVDFWLGHKASWYDSVNDRLYGVGVDTGTAPRTYYLFYITLETGAVTNVGNVQITANPVAGDITLADCAMTRPNIDSGNFTLVFADTTIVLNESTGAEVSHTIETNAQFTTGTYQTADGTILVSTINFSQSGAGGSYVILHVNGLPVYVPMVQGDLISGDAGIYAHPWGTEVKLVKESGSGIPYLHTMLRTEFDTYVRELADHGGQL